MDATSQSRWDITYFRYFSRRRLVAAFMLAGAMHAMGIALPIDRLPSIRPANAPPSTHRATVNVRLVAPAAEVPPRSLLPQAPHVGQIGAPSFATRRKTAAAFDAPISRKPERYAALSAAMPARVDSTLDVLHTKARSSLESQTFPAHASADRATAETAINTPQAGRIQSYDERALDAVRVGLCDIPTPDYPSRAKRLGNAGRVELLLSVDEFGHPTHVEVVSSSRFDDLDAAAKNAASRGTCQPYLESGQPRPVRRTQVVQFALDD